MPGAPLSVPPAASAAAWNASTVASIGRRERDVGGRAGSTSLVDPEVRLLAVAHPERLPLGELHDDPDPERLEGLEVEGPRALVVGHVERYVVEHASHRTT